MTEPLNLRIKDVNLEAAQLTIRAAEGGKDRVVAIPCSALEDLREQLQAAQEVWRRDQQDHPCYQGQAVQSCFCPPAARQPHRNGYWPGENVVRIRRKKLELAVFRWEFPHMRTLTVDDRQRVRLPKVQPGQVFAYERDSDGSIKLVPVVAKRSPKRILARLVKRDGGMFFDVKRRTLRVHKK